MNAQKIRKKFISYFQKHGHLAVQSSSLWPHDDPSVLLTTAGMQQFKPYFMGIKNVEQDFHGKRLTSVQRCFRTSDIESVGDATHNTFFEMLGNFSVGDYFKKDAIVMAWEFVTDQLGLDAERLWVTVFSGDEAVAKDTESIKLWKKFLPKERIATFGRKENWWGPPGTSGPCGPCSEIHYDFTGQPCAKGKACLPNCSCGRFMELWNLVFMEFNLDEKGTLTELPNKNIDTGMGLERLAIILQEKKTLYDTDLFGDILEAVIKDKNFVSTNPVDDAVRSRIIADHFKAAVFLLADGISFSNKEQGYVLRKIFRRALDQYILTNISVKPVLDAVVKTYDDAYPFLSEKRQLIAEQMEQEFQNYQKVLSLNIQEVVSRMKKGKGETPAQPAPSSRSLTADEAFQLYSTYGLSPERLRREGFTFDHESFTKLVDAHQAQSRAGAKNKFGGHGLNSGEWSEGERVKMTRYHTATHLLHQALRDVLGQHIRQQGSDINPERLRFDFEHPSKVSDEERQKIEAIVNEKIKQDLPVTKQEMRYDEAIKAGALAFFKDKYGERVSVYSVGDYSKELCGGPHVTHTGEIGNFKIQSEKSSSAGIRRIKAILE